MSLLFGLRKLLFGARQLKYLAVSASGRACEGTLEVDKRVQAWGLQYRAVLLANSRPGDPCVFAQVDDVGETDGLLNRLSKTPKLPRRNQVFRR